jgi:hypothetical protein
MAVDKDMPLRLWRLTSYFLSLHSFPALIDAAHQLPISLLQEHDLSTDETAPATNLFTVLFFF